MLVVVFQAQKANLITRETEIGMEKSVWSSPSLPEEGGSISEMFPGEACGSQRIALCEAETACCTRALVANLARRCQPHPAGGTGPVKTKQDGAARNPTLQQPTVSTGWLPLLSGLHSQAYV